jgi:hypothetical protein
LKPPVTLLAPKETRPITIEDRFISRLQDKFSLEDVGSTLLQDLAKGIYQPDEVIREYVQNAVDAHRLWRDETGSDPDGPIQIEIRGDIISIYDYGIGMDEIEVRKVKAIAVSDKPMADVSLTGYKGVGIWAGLSYFDTLELYSTKRGVDRGYRLTIQFKEIVDAIDQASNIGEVLNPHYRIEEFEETRDEHFTVVNLKNPIQPRSGDEFTNPNKVRDAIRRICPCEIDPTFVFHREVMDWYSQQGFESFQIELDGMPVYRSYPSTVEEFTEGSITVNDVPVAVYWSAVNKSNRILSPKDDQLVGFRIIQNGFVLGKTNSYSEDLKVHSYLNWYIGEIHVTLPDLRPNLPRRQFEESEITRQFVDRLGSWYEEAATEARTLSETRKLVASYEEYEDEIKRMLNQGAPLALSVEDRQKIGEIESELAGQEDTVEKNKGKRKPHYKIAALRETKPARRRVLSRVRDLQPHVFDGGTGPKEVSVPLPQNVVESIGQSDAALTSVSSQLAARPELPEDPSTLAVPISIEMVDMEPEDDTGDDRQTISIEVVLSLLEEILSEELLDDSDRIDSIVNTLRTRLGSVISNG